MQNMHAYTLTNPSKYTNLLHYNSFYYIYISRTWMHLVGLLESSNYWSRLTVAYPPWEIVDSKGLQA